jgi:hypothetical protein
MTSAIILGLTALIEVVLYNRVERRKSGMRLRLERRKEFWP